MDLSTKYLGLPLKHPVIAGASPLSKDIDGVRRLEDAGAAAIVTYSLFEEQFQFESEELDHFLGRGSESFAEALSYFPKNYEYARDPEDYLEHIRKARASVQVPVIASLNGFSAGGWVRFAKKLEEAGASALELNIYSLSTDPTKDGRQVEQVYLDTLADVKKAVKLPVAMKLSPYFSAFANLAKRLSDGGANGLVLFNRFYQPDINIDELEVEPKIALSTSAEKLLPMRWIALLHGWIGTDLCATSGSHSGRDVAQMLLAGASAVQVASALLRNGPGWIGKSVQELAEWMEKMEYSSVQELVGVMSQAKCPNPAAFERANYMKALNNYKEIGAF